MNVWIIVALVAVVAIGLWVIFRKTVASLPAVHIMSPMVGRETAAPGINPGTGQVPTNAPPPPPPANITNMLSQLGPRLFGGSASGSNAVEASLQHVPLVGGALTTGLKVAKLPTQIAVGAANRVNNTLAHVPVVGSALAAPGKVAGKVASYFGF